MCTWMIATNIINSHIPWFAIVVVWPQANDFQSYFGTVYFTKADKSLSHGNYDMIK